MNQIMSWFRNFHYRVYHIQGKTTDYWKVVINATDKIITLSTCYDDNRKTVVHAKLLKKETR